MAGGFNTVVGYLVFAALTYLLTGIFPYAYMFANVFGSIIAITVAYVNYKFFVFKTKGNYLREYLRFYVVYGASALLNLALLPLSVGLIGQTALRSTYVPYVAQAVLIPICVLFSFVGHRKFSFRHRPGGQGGIE